MPCLYVRNRGIMLLAFEKFGPNYYSTAIAFNDPATVSTLANDFVLECS